MLTGLRLPTKNNRKGLTLLELLIAVVLMSVIFMAVSSLYLASRRLYVASSDKVIIGYELQYATQHIYKYVMRAVGDINRPSFQVYSGGIPIIPPATSGNEVRVNINNSNPLTQASYLSGMVTQSYLYDSVNKRLMFSDGVNPAESLIPKVSVDAVSFTPIMNVNGFPCALTGSITATYGSQSLTFYFSCYPRLASFN